jgi:hypothetical protein
MLASGSVLIFDKFKFVINLFDFCKFLTSINKYFKMPGKTLLPDPDFTRGQKSLNSFGFGGD